MTRGYFDEKEYLDNQFIVDKKGTDIFALGGILSTAIFKYTLVDVRRPLSLRWIQLSDTFNSKKTEEESFDSFKKEVAKNLSEISDEYENFNKFVQKFIRPELNDSIMKILFKCLYTKYRYDTVDEIIQDFKVFELNVKENVETLYTPQNPQIPGQHSSSPLSRVPADSFPQGKPYPPS